MPAVLVHGVPEADAIWSPLLDALDRDDVICLSPPGFGTGCPDGWEPSPGAYVSWLVEELSAMEGPVDLVGHDWGGGHVVGAVIERPDLVRSWASDVLGIFHPTYIWHDTAQIWRTPGEGEANIEGLTGASLEDRKALLAALGLDGVDLDAAASAVNADMGRCILGLYRGAGSDRLAELYDRFDQLATVPGLAVVAAEDPYVGGEDRAVECAANAGAKLHRLDGLGHWWMVQDPVRSAAMLSSFWSEVANGN